MSSSPIVYSGATPDSLPAGAAKVNANFATLDSAVATNTAALAAEATARGAGDAAASLVVGGRLLAATATPVQIYGAAGAAVQTLASFPVPGNSLVPDSIIEIDLLCRFPTNLAGRVIYVTFGAVTVQQTFPTTAVGALSAKIVLFVAPDLKSLSYFSQNINSALSPAAAVGLAFGTRSGDLVTNAVDLTVDQTFTIAMQPVNDDIAELTGFAVRNVGRVPTARVAPASSIAAWGDSLTAGSGSVGSAILRPTANTSTGSPTLGSIITAGIAVGMTISGPGIPVNTTVTAIGGGTVTMSANATATATGITTLIKAGSYPQQLMYASAGRPVANLGIGGQTSAQIAARVLADRVRGKYWTCVFWMGRNDVGLAGTTTSLVLAGLATAVGNLAPGVPYIVCTVLPAANETTGTALNNTILALNAAIKAAYPNNYVDLFTTLAINGDGTVLAAWRASNGATEVHLNDLGYAQVTALISAKLTALGA